MNLLSLMWASLFRKPLRTGLTIASVAIAFLLFVLLRSLSAAFDSGLQVSATERMVVSSKFSQVGDLPYSQKQQILSLEGVEAIAHWSWFGGVYQDGRTFFAQFPVEPLEYFDMYPEYDLEPADALERFARERTAAVVDLGLVERFGWEVGQVVPIQGNIYPQNDGSRLWEFEIVGVYSEDGKPSDFPVMLFNYDYFNEAAAFGRDRVSNWILRLSDPERAAEIAQEIDALYANSADPTKTATEDEMNRQFARQLGDIGLITNIIMLAVFFTIILLTGNTMTQALRERIPELAVLKTLGFGNTTVSLMVLGEAILLCLVGAAIGAGIGLAMSPGLSESMQGLFSSFAVMPTIALEAVVLAMGIGLLIGVIPAVNAHALSIVDALRR